MHFISACVYIYIYIYVCDEINEFVNRYKLGEIQFIHYQIQMIVQNIPSTYIIKYQMSDLNKC